MNTLEISFGNLIDSIQLAHKELAAQADRSVNLSLTVRNYRDCGDAVPTIPAKKI